MQVVIGFNVEAWNIELTLHFNRSASTFGTMNWLHQLGKVHYDTKLSRYGHCVRPTYRIPKSVHM
jgi:hypothetical protein